MPLASDIFAKFRGALSFYEGQYLGLILAFRKGAEMTTLRQEIETLDEFKRIMSHKNESFMELDLPMLKCGYESGLWLAMGHFLSPEPFVNGIPYNLRIQGWTTEGIRDGLRFGSKNDLSEEMIQAELQYNEELLHNTVQKVSMKFGASPRIYQEGYRKGLINALRLLGYFITSESKDLVFLEQEGVDFGLTAEEIVAFVQEGRR